MQIGTRVVSLIVLCGLSSLFSLHTTVYGQDRVMGQIQFVTASKVTKTSGVWIDGQYVGNLGELKGSNRLRLLPGNHDVVVRQAGYSDFTQKVVIEPRMVVDIHVSMEKDPRFAYPDPKTSSEIRLDVQPGRAAVFLDGYYVGTVDEYYGVEHAMLVIQGKHHFKIALAGYKTFETEVDLSPRQKFELRTELAGGSINDADPSIRLEVPAAISPVNEINPTAAR